MLLYVLMARVALPRVGGILQARSDAIAGDLAEAQKFRTQSEAALADYEKALADARNRAQAIANETREKFVAEADEGRRALEASLNAKLAEAERAIAATKSAAMANVRGIAADTAGAIVQQLSGETPNKQQVERAVDTALH